MGTGSTIVILFVYIVFLIRLINIPIGFIFLIYLLIKKLIKFKIDYENNEKNNDRK